MAPIVMGPNLAGSYDPLARRELVVVAEILQILFEELDPADVETGPPQDDLVAHLEKLLETRT